MSLLYNMLSRFIVAFLPRSKHLLISWLPSPSSVLLETKKINCHCFHCFSICQEVMVLDAWSLIFECWVLSQLFHFPLSLSSRGCLVPLCFLPRSSKKNTIDNMISIALILGWYGHFDNIDSSNLIPWYIFPFVCVIFDFFHQHLTVFGTEHNCFVSLGRFMFRFYILFDEMLYEIVSLFSLAVISFLLYTIQKISVYIFCILQLHPFHWWNLVISLWHRQDCLCIVSCHL